MVLVITHDNLPEPFPNLARTVMLPMLKLGLYGFELRNHPLHRRDSPDGECSATPEMPTIVSESQEYKGFWFSLATPFSISEGKPPELDQPRLVRMQFQTELYQPLLKITQEPFGISPVLKAQHKVSSADESHPDALAEPYVNLSAHTAPAMEPRRAPICQ